MRWWPFKSKSEAKSINPVDIEELFAGAPTSAGVSVSAEIALRVPAVAAAIRTISEAAASLDVNVVEIAPDRSEIIISDHPVTALLSDEANPWTSGFEMIRHLVVDALTRDVGGLAYANHVRGAPAEIIRYHPGIISADLSTNDTGEPIYRINGEITPAQNIIHVRGPFARAPVTLAREAIGVALSMERHAGRLFGSGARPGGIIRTKKNVGDEGVKKMLAGWRAAHEGPGNSGKTAVLWDDAEWVQQTLNSVDAQFHELRLFQLQEIARAFNIPASLIGDLTRATWSNSAEMQRQFLLLCLEPWLKALEGAFRRALFKPEDRKRYAVRFDRDDFSNVDLTARATAINSLVASRVINPNEGRGWLGGLAPYEGGDEFANPNTGASQPVAAQGGSEVADLRREIERIRDAA